MRSAVLLIAIVLAGLLHIAFGRTPVASSVRILEPISQYAALCNSVLGQAAKLSGSDAINFHPTQTFFDDNLDGTPETYCYSLGGGDCEPATKEAAGRFQEAMTHCFQQAYNLGFRTIVITPRMDEKWNRKWRNEMTFDPYMMAAGWSYKTTLIDPIIAAINTLKGSKLTKVYFNLQGEMNGVLITYPKGWNKLLTEVRTKLEVPSKVGLNVNFNKVCSWCGDGGNKWKPSGGPEQTFDNAAIQQLFTEADFIGMSAYASQVDTSEAYPTSTPEKIQASLLELAGELIHFGVDLKKMHDAGTEIHYTEFGLGGATCGDGNCPAANAWDVARYPYFGVYPKEYDWNLDPWKNTDSRNFRVAFYKNTIKYVAGDYDWKLQYIFMWCQGTYDTQGIFPGSTTPYGSFADPDIINAIKAWNKFGTVPT